MDWSLRLFAWTIRCWTRADLIRTGTMAQTKNGNGTAWKLAAILIPLAVAALGAIGGLCMAANGKASGNAEAIAKNSARLDSQEDLLREIRADVKELLREAKR